MTRETINPFANTQNLSPRVDPPTPNGSGIRLPEILLVIAIIGVLVGLLMPALSRSSSGAARRMSCSNNIKHLGLAMHNYHAAYDQLPSLRGGTESGNRRRLSGLAAMLPFLEQQELWQQIESGSRGDHPSMGPVPWNKTFDPWTTEIPGFRCPTDGQRGDPFGRTNYVFCIGDLVQSAHSPVQPRGFFGGTVVQRFGDITDGISHTIAMGEVVTHQDDRRRDCRWAIDVPTEWLIDRQLAEVLFDENRPDRFRGAVRLSPLGRGQRWADGAVALSGFQTIQPPGGGQWSVGRSITDDGLYVTSSLHVGGTHVLMGDGAVKFLTQSIDASPSEGLPHGLWGALGTATGGESIDENF